MDRRTFLKDSGKALGALSLLGAGVGAASAASTALIPAATEPHFVPPTCKVIVGSNYQTGDIRGWDLGWSRAIEINLRQAVLYGSCDDSGPLNRSLGFLDDVRLSVVYTGDGSRKLVKLTARKCEAFNSFSMQRVFSRFRESPQDAALSNTAWLMPVGVAYSRRPGLLVRMDGLTWTCCNDSDNINVMTNVTFRPQQIKIRTPLHESHPAWMTGIWEDTAPCCRALLQGAIPAGELLYGAVLEYEALWSREPAIAVSLEQWNQLALQPSDYYSVFVGGTPFCSMRMYDQDKNIIRPLNVYRGNREFVIGQALRSSCLNVHWDRPAIDFT